MKNAKTSSSGDRQTFAQYWAPVIGPSCQMARKLRPPAAKSPTRAAKVTRNETAIGIIRTDRSTHQPPRRITASASATGTPNGPHHRYWGKTRPGPITSRVHTRPMFDGLNRCRPSTWRAKITADRRKRGSRRLGRTTGMRRPPTTSARPPGGAGATPAMAVIAGRPALFSKRGRRSSGHRPGCQRRGSVRAVEPLAPDDDRAVTAGVDAVRHGQIHGSRRDVERGYPDRGGAEELVGASGCGEGAQPDLEVRVGADVEVLEPQQALAGGESIHGGSAFTHLVEAIEGAASGHNRARLRHLGRRGLVEREIDILLRLQPPWPGRLHLQTHEPPLRGVRVAVGRTSRVEEWTLTSGHAHH